MGYEYTIHLRESDLEAIRKDPRGITSIAELLQQVPCFKAMSSDGTRFFFNSEEAGEGSWDSQIVVTERSLELCSYRSSDYACIVPFLLDRLMDLCGRFEMEEA